MTTIATFKGDIHQTDTVDERELGLPGGTYSYSLKVWDGGNVHLKVEYYTGDQIGIGPDYVKGSWKTVEERIKVESDHTTTGSFSIPTVYLEDGVTKKGFNTRVKFSRGVLTKGANYSFVLND